MDDILFRSISTYLFDDFMQVMSNEFEISMVDGFTFFLGLQIK